jgi:hypothetical protein
LLSFADSAPRAYWLKAGNAYLTFSTSTGAFPRRNGEGRQWPVEAPALRSRDDQTRFHNFAEQRGVALVGITHFTKGSEDRDPIERVTGSLVFGALARCVWGASKDDDDRQRRLVRIASNIGPSGGGIEYTLYQAPLPDHDFTAQRVDWGAQLKGSARELLNAKKQSAQADAATFLASFLADGPKIQRDVKDAAEAHGHSWATILRGKKKRWAPNPNKPAELGIGSCPRG